MAGKVVAAVCLLLLWSGAASVASAQPAPTAQCAWQFMSDSTVLDVAFPDATRRTGCCPTRWGRGDTIELSGTYPAARYFSLNTYGTNFDTVDTLRDNQIGPDPGSGNPFADAAAGALPATQKRWHATVVTGPADHSRNQIQALPAGADAQSVPVGFLIIRVYVPTTRHLRPAAFHYPT